MYSCMTPVGSMESVRALAVAYVTVLSVTVKVNPGTPALPRWNSYLLYIRTVHEYRGEPVDT